MRTAQSIRNWACSRASGALPISCVTPPACTSSTSPATSSRADTDINRALRFVVERLWQLTRDGANRRQLELLREWMEGVTLPKAVNREALDDAHITRLNRAYVPVINLARLFLDGGALQLAADTTQTYSFVFDMNVLFESFVFRFLQRHRGQILP